MVNHSGFYWSKRWRGGSGISWTTCKSFEPRSRQITMPVPHQSVFTGRMPFLLPNQKHQITKGIWSKKTWPKSGACCAPFHEGAGFPSNTMSPWPRSTSIPTHRPSGILIHPTVWPQYTNVTDRTDKRTVLQNRANYYLYLSPKGR